MFSLGLRLYLRAVRLFVVLSIAPCLLAGIAFARVIDGSTGELILPLADRTPLQRLTLCLNHLNTGFDASTADPAGINAYPDSGDVLEPQLWQGCLALEKAKGVSKKLDNARDKARFPALVFATIGAAQLPKSDYLIVIEALAHLLNLPENRELRIRLIGHASCLYSPAGWADKGAPEHPSEDPAFQDTNLRLSLARADFVRRALSSGAWTNGHPVSSGRMVVEGRGFFEPRNGGDFKASDCDDAAIFATGKFKDAGGDPVVFASSLKSRPEILQQRVEIAIESPVAVRYGLRAEGQTVSRLVADHPADKKNHVQHIIRFFPDGVRPSEYHSVNLGAAASLFAVADAPLDRRGRLCWARTSGWLKLLESSELDPQDRGGALRARFRIVPRMQPGGRVTSSFLLDLAGRPVPGLEKPGEGEVAVSTLSMPAIAASQERIAPFLAALMTDIGREKIAKTLGKTVRQTKFSESGKAREGELLVRFRLDHDGDEDLQRRCLPVKAAADDKADTPNEADVNKAIDAIIARLPQTHEDILARLTGSNLPSGIIRLSAGMKLCAQPASTHSLQGASLLGIAAETCTLVREVPGDGGRDQITLSSAYNPFVPGSGPMRADPGGKINIAVATNWYETAIAAGKFPIVRELYLFRPAEDLHAAVGLKVKLDAPRIAGWADGDNKSAFILAGFGDRKQFLVRGNQIKKTGDPQETWHPGCQSISKTENVLKDGLLKSGIPGSYGALNTLFHRSNDFLDALISQDPHCVVVPRHTALTTLVPLRFSNRLDYWELGATIAEVGTALLKSDTEIMANGRKLKAFAGLFPPYSRPVIDTEPGVILRLPVLTGDALPW